jgi:hypothetical protein
MAQRHAVSRTSKSVWGFDPTSISGCVLWLDGADRNTTVRTVGGSTPAAVGERVAEWKDKSIMANHGTISFFSGPLLENENNLSFGSSNGLRLANVNLLPLGASDGTYFTVTKLISTGRCPIISYGTASDSQSRTIYDGKVSGNSQIGAIITGGITYDDVKPIDINGGIDSQITHITTLTVNNLIGSLWVSGNPATKTNADLQDTATAVNTGNTNAYIGRYITSFNSYMGNDYFGNINEILVYNSALSNTDRQIVEGYLAVKWGLQSQLPTDHPYKDSVRPLSRNFVPPDIHGCQLWVDPSDASVVTLNGTGKVTMIEDKSGSGNDVENASSTVTYTSTLNGLPALQFPTGGGNNLLSTIRTITRNPVKRTYFFVIKYGATSSDSEKRLINYGNRDYFRQHGGSSQNKTLDMIPSSTGTPGTDRASQIYTDATFSSMTAQTFFSGYTFVLCCVRDREYYTFSTNGVSVDFKGNPVGDTPSGLSYIIRSAQDSLVGDVIIYNAALTKSDLVRVEGYLMWKWGVRREASLRIPIPSTHMFYNFPPNSVTPRQPELLLYKREFDPADLSPVIWIDPQDNSMITKSTTTNRVTQIKNKGRLNLPFTTLPGIEGPLVTTNASSTGIGQQFLDFSNGGIYQVTAATVEANLTTLTLTVSPPHNGAIPVGRFINFTCSTGTYPGGSSATLETGPFQILSAEIVGTVMNITTVSNHNIGNSQKVYLTINNGNYKSVNGLNLGADASGLTGEYTTAASGNSGDQIYIPLTGTPTVGIMGLTDGNVRNNVGTSGYYLTQAGTTGSTVILTSYSQRGSSGSLANFTGRIEYGQIPFTSATVLVNPLRLSIRTPINHGLPIGSQVGLSLNNNLCLPFQTSIPAANPLNAAAIRVVLNRVTIFLPPFVTTPHIAFGLGGGDVNRNPFFVGSVDSPTYTGVGPIKFKIFPGTTYTDGTDASDLVISEYVRTNPGAAGPDVLTFDIISGGGSRGGSMRFNSSLGILYTVTATSPDNSSFINGTATTRSGTSGNTIVCNIPNTPPMSRGGYLIKTTNPISTSDNPVVQNGCILSPVKGFALDNTSLGTALNTNQMTIIWASCLTRGYYRNNFSNANIQSSVLSAALTSGAGGGSDATSFRIQTSSNKVGTSRISIIRGGTGGAISPAIVPGGRILTDTTSHFRINHAIMNLSGTAVDDIPGNTHAIATNGWGYASRFANPVVQATSGGQAAATLSPTHLRIGANTSASTIIISTEAGNGTVGFSGDGGDPNAAQLTNPYGVAVDSAGNIYIADTNNNRIRKITVSTGIITTVAGTGGAGGPGGDGGQAISAQLDNPYGVSLDSAGNIYIADAANNRIRKVTVSTGIITTVAGNGTTGSGGDGGQAISAQLDYPSGVSVDSAGNIYISDLSNHRIRKVTVSTGIITTVAGNGTTGSGGDGGAATSAQLNSPFGVSVSSAGNIFIADTGNHCTRMVPVANGYFFGQNMIANRIYRIAGSTVQGFGGDGGPAISAQLNAPYGVSVDSAGNNVYIADSLNNRIRKVYSSYLLTSDWYEGGLGDVMIFNSVLTFEQRKLVEGYISEKYRCQEFLGGTSNVLGEFLHPYRTTSTRISSSVDLTKIYAKGLAVWFDAANSDTITFVTGVDIATWKSAGGNLPLTLQSTSPRRPTLVNSAQNGLPGIRFATSGSPTSGSPIGTLAAGYTNPVTSFSTLSANNEYTIITVYTEVTHQSTRMISNILSSATNNPRLSTYTDKFIYYISPTTEQTKTYSPTPFSGQPYIVVNYRRGNTMYARRNGTQDAGTTTSGSDLNITATNFGLIFGAYSMAAQGTNAFVGNIYEHIIFRYALSDQEIFQIEGYLMGKWGLNDAFPSTHAYYRIRT